MKLSVSNLSEKTLESLCCNRTKSASGAQQWYTRRYMFPNTALKKPELLSLFEQKHSTKYGTNKTIYVESFYYACIVAITRKP